MADSSYQKCGEKQGESEEAWQHIPSGEPTPEEEILQKEMEKQLRDILRNFSKKQEQKTL